jgi:hypothetical protein
LLTEAKRICDQLVRLDLTAQFISYRHYTCSFKILVSSLVNHHHLCIPPRLTHLNPKQQQPHPHPQQQQQQRLSRPLLSPTLPRSSCPSVCLAPHSPFTLRCTRRPRHDTQLRLTINIRMLLVTIRACRPNQLPLHQRRPPLHPPQLNSSRPRQLPLLQH